MDVRLRIGSVALAVVVGGWAVAWSLCGAAPTGGRAGPDAGGPTPAGRLGFATNASCSAQACHGRTTPVAGELAQRNEYTFCLAHDKHARAYAVLLEGRARRIAENLAPTDKDGRPIPADRDERCLACHTTPQAAARPAPSQQPDPA